MASSSSFQGGQRNHKEPLFTQRVHVPTFKDSGPKNHIPLMVSGTRVLTNLGYLDPLGWGHGVDVELTFRPTHLAVVHLSSTK